LGPGPDAGSGGASLTAPLDAASLALRPSTLVAGKYKVLGELGHGGVGVVYKAEDLTLKRCVAPKFLPPHLVDAPEFQERFAIEARAAAALSHPNICIVHEVGESDGQPYIAMEFADGETLKATPGDHGSLDVDGGA
jgi:non-specific serine/threonine protein kinase